MGTPAQDQANRENSQRSTGPTTSQGQQASAQNAIKHGLASSSKFAVLPDEDLAAFKKLVDDLRAEHKPQSRTESDIVYRMAQHEWLRARAIRYQNYCLVNNPLTVDTARFSVYLRYQRENERGYSQCLKDLASLRAEIRKVEIGFVSQTHRQAAGQRAERSLALREKMFELQKSRAATRQRPQETPNSAETSPGAFAQAA